MDSFKTYFTEVTKKNILSGLDKIATDYQKELESRAVMFRFSYGSYDQEDALSGIIVPKMPKGVEKMNRPRYFYYGEDPDTLYSVHPVVLKFYDGLENDFEGMDPQQAQDLLFEFHALVEDAYRNAFGQDPDEDEEIDSTTKKNILSGLDKISAQRDPSHPDNKTVYGEIYFEYDGLFPDYIKYATPEELPPDCVYAAKGAFIKKGQDPDYVENYPFVYITNKQLMDTFYDTYGDEEFTTNPITLNFMHELYRNLRIDGENDPKLP